MKIAHIMPLRTTVRVLMNNGALARHGMQSRIAREYGVSRQRVGRVVREERRKAA